METAQVISINPGAKTAGALHEEAIAASELSRRLLATAAQAPQLSETFNFVLGLDDSTQVSARQISARIAGGVALTAMATWSYFQSGESALGIAQFILGISLMGGVLTRIVGAIIAVWAVVMSVTVGSPEQALLFTGLSGVIGAIFGPGRMSVDFSMRRYLQRMKHRAADRRARKASAVSYKAFHYAG
ncbi:MAG: hypothetical protein K2M37_07830 [Muribaculaceae bacterium]|nr:hypothetical protein [Muribaculaceae bacterium]